MCPGVIFFSPRQRVLTLRVVAGHTASLDEFGERQQAVEVTRAERRRHVAQLAPEPLCVTGAAGAKRLKKIRLKFYRACVTEKL